MPSTPVPLQEALLDDPSFVPQSTADGIATAWIPRARIHDVLARLKRERGFRMLYDPAAIDERDIRIGHSLFLMFATLAVASMIGGNLLALLQQNLKCLLAYSSIAHFGYLLVAFLASGTQAAVAETFYLVAYFITTIAAFGIVTILSSGGAEVETANEYRGLSVLRPGASSALTIMLLSLAGIPMTAGFVGKCYVALTAAEARSGRS